MRQPAELNPLCLQYIIKKRKDLIPMKKLLNKKGFTLMEMLIVVAIIVILVVISIPMFSGSLDSAKKATDDANLRAAKAAYVVQTLTDTADKIDSNKVYYYDFDAGKFVVADTAAKAKEAATNSKSLGQAGEHSGDYITIEDGKVVWKD